MEDPTELPHDCAVLLALPFPAVTAGPRGVHRQRTSQDSPIPNTTVNITSGWPPIRPEPQAGTSAGRPFIVRLASKAQLLSGPRCDRCPNVIYRRSVHKCNRPPAISSRICVGRQYGPPLA